jgi:hypothetical protein
MAVAFDTSTMHIVLEIGGARDLVFTKPSNLASGERVVVVITADSASAASDISWTVPSGFNQVITEDLSGGTASYPPLGMWEKTAGGSEPSTYTFSYATDAGTLNNGVGVCIRVTGADSTFSDQTYVQNLQSSTTSPVASSIVTQTANAMLLAITASADGRFLTSQDAGYPTPDWTGILARVASSSSSSPTLAIAYKEQAAAGASGTATFTSLQGTSHQHRTVMFAIRALQVANTPIITDFGDEVHAHGETAVVITGTNFNASQGDGFVIVSPTDDPDDVNAVTQTVTSWGATSIEITTDLDTFSFDTNLYLFVQNSDEEVNAAGFIFQRLARWYLRDDLIDLSSVSADNLASINYIITSDAAMQDQLGDGTGEVTDATGDFEIEYDQGGQNPNSPDPVWLIMNIDGAVGSELGGIWKLNPVVE